MKIKKTVLALTLALVAVCSCASASTPAEAILPITPATLSADGGISPQAEETVWYTRWYNGKQQKRLWSITHSRWLTDWIDMD